MGYVQASVGLAVMIALSLVGSDVGAAVQSKCLVAKNRCVSKKAEALVNCERKAQKPGNPTDPNTNDCVDKVRRKFDGGDKPEKGCFENLENRKDSDCVTLDDTAAAEELVDSCVAAFVAAIDPPPITQTKCGAAKLKCVAQKLKSILACYRLAQTPGKPTDPNTKDCITKAQDSFDGGVRRPTKGCFEKIESAGKNDCQPPLDNTLDLEVLVDDCADRLVGFLEGAG